MEIRNPITGEVKLSPCLTKHYAMKTNGRVDILIHVLLASAILGDEWSASRSGRFTSLREPLCSLVTRLSGPQSRPGRYGVAKTLDPTGTGLQSIDCPARSQSLYLLRCRILYFLDRRRHFFFQVVPQLYSRGWVDPALDLLLLGKSCSAGNRTRTSGSKPHLNH
jgi:hypothetical protein